jgi:lactate dehydrogenase-like 2-hydroxyacid dehydrogenase
MIKILITEKEYNKAVDIFKSELDFECIPANLDENILAKAVKDNNAFGVILGVDAYKDELYKSLPKGSIIARFGVGHDGVDKNQATANGIIITNTPGVLDDSVAEHAMMLIGCFARNISKHANEMKNKQWQPVIGSELKGKTLLILGCGPIGRKTAKIASFGFGMNVIGYDIVRLDEERMKQDFGFNKIVSKLDEVISQADYISIHIPSLPATRHFINREFLSHLKSSCVIINTSRGPVADEEALYDALRAGRISGAALDVFENEPFEPVNSSRDLRTLENIILTPHVGSSTVEACNRMAQSCLRNIKAAYDKRYNELDILNPQVLEKLK